MMKISWPVATVLLVGLALIAATYLAAPAMGVPAELQRSFLAALGAAFAVALSVMRGLLSRDADGDGIPDVLEDREGRNDRT